MTASPCLHYGERSHEPSAVSSPTPAVIPLSAVLFPAKRLIFKVRPKSDPAPGSRRRQHLGYPATGEPLQRRRRRRTAKRERENCRRPDFLFPLFSFCQRLTACSAIPFLHLIFLSFLFFERFSLTHSKNNHKQIHTLTDAQSGNLFLKRTCTCV